MNRTVVKIPGLRENEVERSRKEHGENKLRPAARKSFGRSFWENMGDPVIKVLLCALAVNLLFMFQKADWYETIGIAISVFLATLISTLSEYSSQAAFERLEKENAGLKVRVRRVDGRSGRILVKEIPMTEVVVGDVVLLSAGERIPADGILRRGCLGVDQSGMTGESREARKRETGRAFSEDPADEGSLFGGCTVISGEGEMEVVRVGEQTFLGEISRQIQMETRQSPLKLRLSKLAGQISAFGYVGAVLCSLAYLFRVFVIGSGFDFAVFLSLLCNVPFLVGELIHALTLGLTVVVMAVPEGLPMMIAVVLSSNIKRMVRDQVLVRKPVGIEAAGSMNLLFTDKTGTLTEGKMTVGGLLDGDGHPQKIAELTTKAPALANLYRLFCLCGGADLLEGKIVGGNLTDRALAQSALPLGLPVGYTVAEKTAFDSAMKFSAVRLVGRERLSLIKGAPEVLLPFIQKRMLPDGRTEAVQRATLEAWLSAPAAEGWRVLALTLGEGDISAPNRFGSLTFVGAVLLADRLRPQAPAAVEALRGAGIQVVMITGDNRETALSVAKRAGIFLGGNDVILTSREMSRMSDMRLTEILPHLRVIARALPTDKSRLVRIAQQAGLVVGMTGDGVNDAPALRTADIGFAMGGGTQVAKEAGDVIILDNNLSSIVKAVLYGRNIFKSIRKFIVLQLTINLCAVGVTMIGPFIGISAPVTVVQMLWINMIMDTLGGIAFAGEPPLKDCMKEKPKRRDEAILNRYMIHQILLLGSFTVGLCIAFLKWPWLIAHFRGEAGGIYHLTAFFAFFIFAGVFNCFNARTDSLRLFRGLGRNRAFLIVMSAVLIIQLAFVYLGGAVLRTVPLTRQELGFTMLLALSVFPADFLRKLCWRLCGKRRGF